LNITHSERFPRWFQPPPARTIHVEADSLDKVEAALAAGADAILLDNLGVEGVRQAVALADGHEGPRPLLEASGGITLETIAHYAATGVDVISTSQITISAPVLDIGLDIASGSATGSGVS
jgi:nicotinate-nucleotide pyrophosphorylase (carboxylating)